MTQSNEDDLKIRLTVVEREVASLYEESIRARGEAAAAWTRATNTRDRHADRLVELQVHVRDELVKVNAGLAHITTLIEGIAESS